MGFHGPTGPRTPTDLTGPPRTFHGPSTGFRAHSPKLLYFEWSPPWHFKTAKLDFLSAWSCQVRVVRHTTHLLKCARSLSSSQTDWRQSSDILSDISFDILSRTDGPNHGQSTVPRAHINSTVQGFLTHVDISLSIRPSSWHRGYSP